MDDSKFVIHSVLRDIINGYSKVEYRDDLIYIMHLGPIQEADIEKIKFEKYKEAISRGIPSYKEKLDFLIKDKLWSEEESLFIDQQKDMIRNMEATKKSLMFVSQIRSKEEEIKNAKNELNKKQYELDDMIGMTAEKFADKQCNSYYLYYSLYKDIDLKNQFFTKKEFEDLEDDEIYSLIGLFNQSTKYITDENIKKVALSSVIQNMFGLSNDPSLFLGKPICKFTYYQISLCSFAGYYKSILNEVGNNIDEECKNDPDKLEGLFISSRNMEKHKNKQSGESGTTTYFGATKEDAKALGDTDDGDKMSKILSEKGELSMMDMIEMGI